MPADALNPNQFTFRYADQGPDKKTVLAAHPEHGIVGLLNLSRERQNRVGGGGLTSSLVYVHPDFRRQGLANTMYSIGSHQLGYQPMHDVARSPLGDKFARGAGGPLPEQHVKMQGWELDDPSEVAERQSKNWQSGTPVDQREANALMPQKAKPNRRRKPKQLDMGF